MYKFTKKYGIFNFVCRDADSTSDSYWVGLQCHSASWEENTAVTWKNWRNDDCDSFCLFANNAATMKRNNAGKWIPECTYNSNRVVCQIKNGNEYIIELTTRTY